NEHNVDFHPIVDFIEASPLRRNLKLKDEAGISSLPDAELFENLTLMGYNISPNQKFTFQKGQFSHQWKYLIHTIMQCLSPKSTGFNEFSSNIATTLGEGSSTPTEPYHTPFPEAQQTSPTTYFSLSLPPVTTANIPPGIPTVPLPTVVPTHSPQLRHYTRRARIAQSSALPPVWFCSYCWPPATGVPIGSNVVPTAGLIFSTTTVVTPYTRRKGKQKMIESETSKKKKIQEQMDIHIARQLEEEMEREAQRMNEQIS
nr:hypothetical protein [Tanacetum cinerariifolium]